MANIITIPRRLIEKGELVILPRSEYEEVLKLKKRLLWEERDTDEAVRIYKQEKRAGKLKSITSLAEIR